MYIYDRMFGDFPAKNIVYTPIHRIYVVLANPKHVYVSVYQGVRVGSACEVLLVWCCHSIFQLGSASSQPGLQLNLTCSSGLIRQNPHL